MKWMNGTVGGIVTTLFFTGVVFSQGQIWEWEVNTVSPTPIGPEVAKWIHTPASRINPDVVWPVPHDGVLQFVARDHDPKCSEPIGYVKVEGTRYPIPTSPPQPGQDCTHTVNNLFHSRLFEVSKGSEVWGEQGSSGSFVFNFVTSTPSPTPIPTATATETSTPLPPDTVVPPTPTIAATATPLATIVPTETATPELPVPQPPTNLPIIGQPGQYTYHVSIPFIAN